MADKANKPLTGKQARFLRGLGHHLTPNIMIGREGIFDQLVATTDEALSVHELIKIKVQQNSPLDRREAAEELAGRCKAQIAQILGNTFLLYRANKDKRPDKRIMLPG